MTGPSRAAGRTDRVVAIDVGGTKVAMAVVRDDGSFEAEHAMPTPRGDARSAVAAILAAAGRLVAGRDVRAAAIVLPAVVEDGVVAWAAQGIPGWSGLPLATMARDVLGVPTVVEFDGYAATLGEARRGAGRGCRDVAVVIAGTGVGAGIVHDGRLVRGAIGVAGGIGWMRWPVGDGLSEPMESIASGPAILAAAGAAAVRLGRRPDFADTAAVFEAARAGDAAAAGAIDAAVRALAAGVGVIVALLAPELVVLGGGVGARPEVVDRVRELVVATTQPHAAARIRIERSTLGALSSLHGAACLAQEAIHPDLSAGADASPEE